MRRGVPNRIPEFDRRWCQDRRVFGEGVQRKALALGPGLPFAGAVREHAGDAAGSEDVGMKIPHRCGGSLQSQVPPPGSAPGKGSGFEFQRGAREGAAEIVLRMRVPTGETWTARAQNGCDLWSRCSVPQQFLGDPLIGNAPIRLRKPFANAQPVQPFGIDAGGYPIGIGGGPVRARRHRLRRSEPTGVGSLDQCAALRGQLCVSVHHLDPRSVTAPVTSLRFLVSETGQAAQMPPVRAGQIAAVTPGQLFADRTGQRRLQGCGADMQPHLKMAGAGLEHHAGREAIGSHSLDHFRAAVIQVDQDIAGIAILAVGLNVDVAALAVADPQKPQRSQTGELGSGPQPLARESSSGLVVNQADQVKVVRHRRNLAAHGPQGQIESTVEHGPNSGIEGTRRTMNSQRTANTGLTGCLSSGVHRSQQLRWVTPTYIAIDNVLRNPVYAGAYVYGKTRNECYVDEDGVVRKRVRHLPREEWSVFLPGHHEGFIDWATFEANQARLQSNIRAELHQAGRALREGSALLQGLAVCGNCGRRLRIAYPGTNATPRYYCENNEIAGGHGMRCLSVGGLTIDQAVTHAFLEALTPAALEATALAVQQLESQQDAALSQWRLEVERARYEAERAERQYKAVEPENRLVARGLEKEWELRLQDLAASEAELLRRQQQRPRTLTAEEQQRINLLGSDLRLVWTAPTTTDRDRKELLRTLLEEVTS